jgi:hypothetical protein
MMCSEEAAANDRAIHPRNVSREPAG